MYLFISTVLCADTWLLYTRSEKTEENRKRRGFLLGLLVLLPLLLFGGELNAEFEDFLILNHTDDSSQ